VKPFSFFKTHTNLTIIIVAALLIELTTGIIYYNSQDIIKRTTIQVMERENNALYLCIRNKLAMVEVVLDNMSWIVTDDLLLPDSLSRATYQIVENNPMILGSSIACIPHLFPEHGYWFEPYSVRREDGSIETMQLGSESHDYTKLEFFTTPLATGKSHWCEPYWDKEGAKAQVTTYGAPVKNGKGEIVAVVEADLSLFWLEKVINESKAYPSNQRFLVTGNYNLLAGEDNQLLRTSLGYLKKDADKTGYVTMEDEKGQEKLLFYTPVGGKTDWILLNVLDSSDIFDKLRKIRTNLLLMVMAGLLLIGFIVWRSKCNLERLQQVNNEKKRISSELQVASQIQQMMLPHDHLQRDDMDVFGSLVPAREVGGDLFDYFIHDEKLYFCIGDVSGKGTPSAMLMAGTRSFFRAFSGHENNPGLIMQYINESACQGNDTNMFVTLFIGVLDLPTGHLRYCNAGHDVPMILTNGQWTCLEAKPHLPIGLFNEVKYNMMETYIQPNSTIFLYTDGLTEAKNCEHKQFGIKQVEEVLATCTDMHPQELLETIGKAVHGFVGGAEQSDDLTMLAIRYTPQQYESTLNETLTLKNDVHEVSKLSTFQKSFYEKMNLEKSLAHQLRLAVEEAVVNVIEHAYPYGTEGSVEVTMMSDGHQLKVVIDDSGMPFDPTIEKKVDITLSAEERQVGGLGILLVRELMDTINYEYIKGHNILTLRKKISLS
jgi:sigma-B regulation protein RsbU (phosphoserine phosphatase)